MAITSIAHLTVRLVLIFIKDTWLILTFVDSKTFNVTITFCKNHIKEFVFSELESFYKVLPTIQNIIANNDKRLNLHSK